jgi:hypothetical protein
VVLATENTETTDVGFKRLCGQSLNRNRAAWRRKEIMPSWLGHSVFSVAKIFAASAAA